MAKHVFGGQLGICNSAVTHSFVLLLLFEVEITVCINKNLHSVFVITLPSIAALRESSRVQLHPPHLATLEQLMVRGSRDGASPQSSHPRVSKNGSEHFR